MDFQPPRGTQDFLPPESEAVAALYRRATRLAQLYGYRRVETPVFDDTELFRRSSGQTSDVVSKEMYTFEDRGGRSLTLRPEGTAPVLRAYLGHAHSMPSPFKAFYLERMYRYGRPQAGRYREHRQFGLEVIGAAAGAADAEVIAVGNRFLRDVGLRRYELQLNSIGDATCRPAYRTELIAYLAANEGRLRDEHRTTFRDNPLRVLDCKDEACRAVAADAPKMIDRLCEECAAHFAAVRDELDRSDIAYTIVPTLVRGLDYYTRTAFEFYQRGGHGQQSALGGGGRYDGLIELFGAKPTPGIGFGLGVDRIALLASGEAGKSEGNAAHPVAIVVGADPAATAARLKLATELRAAGVPASADLGQRTLSRQLERAAREGAHFAVVVGDELTQGEVQLRDLEAGTQKLTKVTDLPRELQRAHGSHRHG